MKYILIIIATITSFTLTAQDSVNVNSINLTNRYEAFSDNITNRHFTSLEYGRKFGEHDLYVRVTNLYRDGDNGQIYDVDFYPRYKKGYFYFNIGASTSIFFPDVRGAAEVFRSLPRDFEGSVGLRYINVENVNIVAATGTIGKYYGNFYTYVRPTVNFIQNDGTAFAGFVATRYYDGYGKNYLEISGFYGQDTGTSRDFNSILNSFGLDTYGVRLYGKFHVKNNFVVGLGTDYSGLYIPQKDKYVKITGIDLSLKYLFK